MLPFKPGGPARRLLGTRAPQHRRQHTSAVTWRHPTAWVRKEARPISLRQLTFFGRTLTERRLLESANYLREELPARIAHRLRDMQTLPYVVVTNENMLHVYELYYKAFDTLRKVREIVSIEQNEQFCKIIGDTLKEHLTVIPRLTMGMLECRDMMHHSEIDHFMNTLLKSRISRRVIAEQHLALTETFNSPWHFPNAAADTDMNAETIGEVFLRCSAQGVIQDCWDRVTLLAKGAYGAECVLPEINIEGDLDATFPYILSHLQYIVSELLRNSIQALVEMRLNPRQKPPPIEALICEAPQHVIIRISDQGGGIPIDVMPRLWSFSKGARSQTHLKNLSQVPKMAATMQELGVPQSATRDTKSPHVSIRAVTDTSLSSLTTRPPNLRLGMGLPMSRVYAEYVLGLD